jgi:hypothetical protein
MASTPTELRFSLTAVSLEMIELPAGPGDFNSNQPRLSGSRERTISYFMACAMLLLISTRTDGLSCAQRPIGPVKESA